MVESTVPAAVSVFVTGSFEIGIRVDERVVLAGHFAVGFAPARQTLFVVSDALVLCAIAEDDITIIVNATAIPVAHRPLLRTLISTSICRDSFISRRQYRRREAQRKAGDVPVESA